MGESVNVDEIFEIKDEWGTALRLWNESEDSVKQKVLEIDIIRDSCEFVLTKSLTKKLIKELKEAFNLK